MTKYTKDGLVTDDPLVGAMFLGCDGFGNGRMVGISRGMYSTTVFRGTTCEVTIGGDKITIPWPLVAEAIRSLNPPFFVWFIETDSHEATPDDMDPMYKTGVCRHVMAGATDSVSVNPITTGKSVGELRELLKYTGGAV